jgi:hypothetical protein
MLWASLHDQESIICILYNMEVMVYICEVLRLYRHEQICPDQSHISVTVHEYLYRARRHCMWSIYTRNIPPI